MTQNSGDSGLCFEIWFRKRKTQDTYTLQAASREVKDAWTKDLERILWEQAVHNRGTNKCRQINKHIVMCRVNVIVAKSKSRALFVLHITSVFPHCKHINVFGFVLVMFG